MRTFLFAFLLYLFVSCSTADFYGDINLGSNFYYMVEPAFNSINLSTSKNDPMRSSQYVIRDIEWVGFNKNYILAINKTNDITRFWIIDKTQKNIDIRIDDTLVNLSNITNSLDSSTFANYKKKFDIKLLSKEYYQKKLNYR